MLGRDTGVPIRREIANEAKDDSCAKVILATTFWSQSTAPRTGLPAAQGAYKPCSTVNPTGPQHYGLISTG